MRDLVVSVLTLPTVMGLFLPAVAPLDTFLSSLPGGSKLPAGAAGTLLPRTPQTPPILALPLPLTLESTLSPLL